MTNFQDVIRDVHNPDNHALNITGTINAAGQVTVTPLQAWPDPKTYIGLVTITGSFSGNVTLDAGSKTQIVGNITLSDPKGFIGLVSISGFANPLPVTSSGNVTLDAGSKTQIIGNITITDGKTFIGLVTAFPGSAYSLVSGYPITGIVTVTNIGRTISGNLTLDAGSKVGVVGNVTLSDAKTFIGLVTIGGELGYSYAFISGASITVVKSGAGYLKAIVIGMPSLPSTLIFDQTSAAVPHLGALAVGLAPGSYRYDLAFATGLTIKMAATAVVPQVTVIYK